MTLGTPSFDGGLLRAADAFQFTAGALVQSACAMFAVTIGKQRALGLLIRERGIERRASHAELFGGGGTVLDEAYNLIDQRQLGLRFRLRTRRAVSDYRFKLLSSCQIFGRRGVADSTAAAGEFCRRSSYTRKRFCPEFENCHIKTPSCFDFASFAGQRHRFGALSLVGKPYGLAPLPTHGVTSAYFGKYARSCKYDDNFVRVYVAYTCSIGGATRSASCRWPGTSAMATFAASVSDYRRFAGRMYPFSMPDFACARAASSVS